MIDPDSPTGDGPSPATVVVSNESGFEPLDLARWSTLARRVLLAEGVAGELTLTFVDSAVITELNREHMGLDGPTDVLSFPLDAPNLACGEPPSTDACSDRPVLLGDIVVCPTVARDQSDTHAGTLEDELALLVVHGILHVLGHDHAEPTETACMRERELDHLTALHWGGPAPEHFTQEHHDS